MNTPIHSFLIALALPLAGCASLKDKSTLHRTASLGQTYAQITKELGPPTARYMNGFDLFHDSQGNEVQAHFQGGKADSLFYFTFNRKISEPWLSSVLKQNSKDAPWVLEAKSSTGRMVYHTVNGRYYALVSKGNQLMVDKESFFQQALHQPGKTILIDDLPDCVFAPDHGEARIGSATASVIQQYGQPIATAPDGAKEYYDGYQCVVVHYKNGHCDAVLYSADKYKRLNDCWVSSLLQMNSLNAWVVVECSKPKDIYYWTPKGSLLSHLIMRRSLCVYTQDYAIGKNKGLGVKESRKTHFPASITPCAGIWLGETEASMTKKLGAPTLDKKVRVYRDGDLTIRATFDHDICNRIIYISAKKRKFTDHWVSATLAVNSRGRAWFTFEDSTPKKSFYKTYDHKFYARLRNGTDLGIMTEAVYKQAAHKLDDAKPVANQNSK
jgi:hypothetical protein